MDQPEHQWQDRLLEKWMQGGKLGYWLSQSGLIRFFLYSSGFRFLVLGVVVAAALGALSILRLMRVSPRDFNPVIRVSALDLLQAWSLSRAARQAEQENRMEDAIHAWRSAIGNNAANPEYSRGLLRSIVQSDRPVAFAATGLHQSQFLLRLTRTNLADLALTVGLLDRLGLNQEILRLLDSPPQELSPAIRCAFLKALFMAGQIDRFRQEKEPGAAPLPDDPELGLFLAAYDAGWGDPGTVAHARAQLEAAQRDPRSEVLAHRLQLIVSKRLEDPDRYLRSLERLEELPADRPSDHFGYWQLLAAVGRQGEAIRLAQNYSRPPETAQDLYSFAAICLSLDQRDPARQALRQYTPQFSEFVPLWQIHADILTLESDWDALGALAVQIRQQSAARDELMAFTFFLDGRAELGRQNRDAAQAAFEKSLDYPFSDGPLAYRLARELAQFGFTDLAFQFVSRHQNILQRVPDYWTLHLDLARELRRAEDILRATRALYLARTNDIVLINNYAAALIINRQNPDEAVRLTLEVLARNPSSAIAKINHGLALAQNSRPKDAQAILDTIQPASLSPVEASSFYLARYEISLQLEQWDQAFDAYQRILPEYHLPPEITWIETMRRKIPVPQTSAPPAKMSVPPAA
ncbi:MAG TPA: hypothetical protein P5555_00870 [Candidatus Paceibacterota bacterium]|nr:hypothetical protein [Verrucomicrobiota bacterium]HOX02337.1 hypothetical protein [Verrucomicrobiota bacterium]HRZ43724.1 hypothetical protein [Candidatus Paceibacterota bacterium]